MKSYQIKSLVSLMFVLVVSFMVAQTITTVIPIQVSPHVLNLQNSGEVVTIHTEISYSSVDAQSVYLNGVLIQSWKADNQGNFVAKFNMSTIQGLVGVSLNVNAYNTFTLVGEKVNGDIFTGSEVIKVVDNAPVGNNKK